MATPSSSSKPSWRNSLQNWVRSSIFPSAWRTDSPEGALHQHTYDAEYYKFVEFSAAWSRDAMADAIVRDLGPRTIVDVGCGTGALLDAIRSRGVSVAGLEYSDAGLAICRQRKLSVSRFDIAHDRLPRRLRRRDAALSFEVAEHLPADLADRYCDLLCEASDVVVLSAATPGQGGTDHVNEQPHEYWIEKMAGRNFSMDWSLSLGWRSEWKAHTANWYHSNVMVFRRAQLQAQAS